MEEKLTQYLEELVATLKEGGQFAMEQLPLFVHEYLSWGFWESVIWGAILLSASSILIYMAKLFFNKYNGYEPTSYLDDGHMLYIIVSGISAIGSIFAVVGAITNILTAIKITVAPRVYLIENLTNLL
jgi:hypothetical protein